MVNSNLRSPLNSIVSPARWAILINRIYHANTVRYVCSSLRSLAGLKIWIGEPWKGNVQQYLQCSGTARFIFYLSNTTSMGYLVNTDKYIRHLTNLTNINKLTHQLCQNIRDQQWYKPYISSQKITSVTIVVYSSNTIHVTS